MLFSTGDINLYVEINSCQEYIFQIVLNFKLVRELCQVKWDDKYMIYQKYV